MDTLDLITIGDASMDAFLDPSESETLCSVDDKECLVCFKYGDKIPLNALHFSVGGNAANNATGARRLGLSVAVVTSLGDDVTGMQIQDSLAREQINLSFLHKIHNGTSNYSTIINYAGERTIFSYHAPKVYVFPENLPSAKWVYLTSLGEGWQHVFASTLAWKKAHPETKIAFNPGSAQLRAELSELTEVLKVVDLLYVNREEAEHLSGFSESEGREKELLYAVSQLGPKVVVVTDGPAGAFVSNGQATFYCPVFPQAALERTGAGDAFGSGCLSALIKGKPLSDALLWGAINSASVISQVGAQAGLLTEGEMLEWLEKAEQHGIMVREL